jgi:hypothetical protein
MAAAAGSVLAMGVAARLVAQRLLAADEGDPGGLMFVGTGGQGQHPAECLDGDVVHAPVRYRLDAAIGVLDHEGGVAEYQVIEGLRPGACHGHDGGRGSWDGSGRKCRSGGGLPR